MQEQKLRQRLIDESSKTNTDRMTGQTAILLTENQLQCTNHRVLLNWPIQLNWIQYSVFFHLHKISKIIIILQQKVINKVNTNTYVEAAKKLHVQIIHKVNKIPFIPQYSQNEVKKRSEITRRNFAYDYPNWLRQASILAFATGLSQQIYLRFSMLDPKTNYCHKECRSCEHVNFNKQKL